MSSRLSVDCRCDGNKTDTDWLRCYETAALHLNSPLNMRTACKYHGIIKKPLKQVMFWLLMYNRESSSSSCFHPMQLLKASQLNTFKGMVSWLQIKKNIYISAHFWNTSNCIVTLHTRSKTVLTQLQNIEIRRMNALSWGMKIPSPRKKKQCCTHTGWTS